MTTQFSYDVYFNTILKIGFSLILTVFFIEPSYSQRIEDIWIELEDEQVIIHYDLISQEDDQFRIELFSSHNNYHERLNRVSGDAGIEIPPGVGKQIVWEAKEELGEGFQGNLKLEIRASIYQAFVSFTNITSDIKFKRGKDYLIQWEGGNRDQLLSMELVREDTVILSLGNTINTWNYRWSIPESVKPSKDYKLRLTDTNNPDNSVLSQSFSIKRKIPWAIKAIPIGLLGVGAALIAGSPEKGPTEIPDPPARPQ